MSTTRIAYFPYLYFEFSCLPMTYHPEPMAFLFVFTYDLLSYYLLLLFFFPLPITYHLLLAFSGFFFLPITHNLSPITFFYANIFFIISSKLGPSISGTSSFASSYTARTFPISTFDFNSCMNFSILSGAKFMFRCKRILSNGVFKRFSWADNNSSFIFSPGLMPEKHNFNVFPDF